MRLKKKVFTDKIEFEYFINVTSEGLFTTYLPEEVIIKLEKYGIETNYGRGKHKGYFEAQSLKEIQEKVKNIANKFSESKLIFSKIVLRYTALC